MKIEKRKILRKIEQLEKKIAAAKLMEASGADVEGESLEQLQENLEKWKKDEIYVKVSKIECIVYYRMYLNVWI